MVNAGYYMYHYPGAMIRYVLRYTFCTLEKKGIRCTCMYIKVSTVIITLQGIVQLSGLRYFNKM